MNKLQLITAGAGKFGVEGQHLYREVDLVGDALAGAVSARKEFQIFVPVVVSDSVDVMHSLVGQEFSSKSLFHDEAMFKHVLSKRDAVLGGDSKANVSVPSFGSGDFRKSVSRSVKLTGPLVFALLRTEFLLAVDGARTFAPRAVEFFSAVFAFCFVALVGVFSSTAIGTGHRTVQRVLTEFGLVGADIGRFVKERLLALFAPELNQRFLCGNASVNGFVSGNAGLGAKFSRGISRLHFEAGAAILANLVNRHLESPTLAGRGTLPQ